MTVEEKISQMRYDAPAIERLGVPAYNWWNEALHGVARSGVATDYSVLRFAYEPHKCLKDFQKLHLPPHTAHTVHFSRE